MYFAYVCYKGRVWHVEQPCCVFVSVYDDYEQGEHIYPAGTLDFDGLTIVTRIDFKTLALAHMRGFRAIYSNLTDKCVQDLIFEATELLFPEV